MPLDDTNWPAETPKVDETTALLILARSFVERGWCRRMQAQDANGTRVDPTSKQAVAWCADGALFAAENIHERISIRRVSAACRLNDAMGEIGIVPFNDAQETVEPVLAAFDRAIAMSSEG